MNIYKSGVMLRSPADSDKRTYVFFGLERGGTSPIAGIARALGLFLGEGLSGNNEDQEFVHKTVHHIKKKIDERNQLHDIWGWKFPKAAQQLPMYIGNIRNPHLVVIVRDPIAVALGNKKWNGPEMSRPIKMSMGEAAAYNVQNIAVALAASVPVLMISYELYKENLNDAINMIADFLRVDRPDEELRTKISNYVGTGGYKKFEDYFTSGVDVFTE